MTRIAMLQRALQRAITESHQSTAKVVAAEARLERARRAEYRAAKADRDARRASIPGAVGDQSLLQQVDGVDHSGHSEPPALHGLVTRHGTGVSAFRRWLQRMGWFRRPRPAARPSDTTVGGRGAR